MDSEFPRFTHTQSINQVYYFSSTLQARFHSHNVGLVLRFCALYPYSLSHFHILPNFRVRGHMNFGVCDCLLMVLATGLRQFIYVNYLQIGVVFSSFLSMFSVSIFTGRMPQSGKLPVLNLLTGQKSGFSPHRGDSFAHRFTSNLAGPTGTWVRLAVQNFTSIARGGGNAAPKI